MRKLFFLATVSLIVAGMITLGLPTGAIAKDIKVGAIINLTGPASTWGQFHAKGHKDYFRYVNDVKGGIAGNKIKLTVVDHAYKVPEAVKYVKKFCTSDKMDILATWDAGSGIMAKPIIQKYKTPNINYSTYQGILKPPVDYAYLPYGGYNMDSYAVLEYIKNIHKGSAPPKVGLLTYNNAYGKSIHAASKEYAAKNNVNIVSIEQFPPKTLDLNTELLRLKSKGAEYIFMQCLPSAILMALKSADRVKYDVPFFGTWTSTDPDFFKRGKGLIRNRMHMQFPGGLPVDKTPGMKTMEYLWKRYKTVTSFDASYWEGVVIASLMERAFERAYEKFGKINSETINQGLETFRNEDFGGLFPNVTYTKTDHSASWKARIVKINENGTYTPLTSFWGPGKEKVRIIK
ncbi:MAG: ABC transporter substrate-binding protein [Deltaproteobacteria bacterium]|nr:ABC transporter substrate-binding protein [Deltaproteobacteria bacterium]MBW1909505.1 ABC transporter substrate-binding protein [Deltaproteobacteria bacterium]MBW2034327.1 ABC transporter substrate-binding protein [Deltaproteobacteria bacterium]MBW2113919.1 ABC transporter substrate-binding protein [Deltaproteobacteria bacterium]